MPPSSIRQTPGFTVEPSVQLQPRWLAQSAAVDKGRGGARRGWRPLGYTPDPPNNLPSDVGNDLKSMTRPAGGSGGIQ